MLKKSDIEPTQDVNLNDAKSNVCKAGRRCGKLREFLQKLELDDKKPYTDKEGKYSRIRLKCDRHCGERKSHPGNWVAEVWDELTCDDQDEEPQKQARTVEKSRDTGTSLKPSDHIDSQQQTRSGVSGKDFMLQFALARLGSKQ